MFDDFEQDRQRSRSYVEFASRDDAGKLEENGKPSFHPDSVEFRHIDQIFAGVFLEDLRRISSVFPHVQLEIYLWFVADVKGALSNQPDRFHRCVGKG